MVKVVGKLIAAFCQSNREWDKNLPLLTLAYRSSTHEITGYTPNFVMTGWEVALLLDIILGTLEGANKTTAPEYVQKLLTRLKGCFEEVCMHLKRQGEQQRKCYNLSTHGQDYKPGDQVYLMEKTRKKQVCPKLMPKWKGASLVRKFGMAHEVLVTPKTSKVYHYDLLKPCYSTHCPS